MKLRLNNKGYMLVEIILAAVIAMGVAYFITDLTIKAKNRNDDLLVKTLASTDQSIIYNTIMKDLSNENNIFKCSDIKITDNKFEYKGSNNIISDYVDVQYDPSTDCSYTDDGKITINIGLDVPQLSDDFDVKIEYIKEKTEDDTDEPVEPEVPEEPEEPGESVLACTLSANGSTNVITATINNSQTLSYSGWDSNMVNDNGVLTKNITSTGSFTYYVKDESGLTATCSMSIVTTTKTNVCPSGYSDCQGGSCDCYKSISASVSGYNVSGSCTCRDAAGSAGYTAGVCLQSGCSCGGTLTVRTDNCVSTPKYTCSSGYSLSGNRCYKYSSYSGTSYSCSSSGYTKLNNTYCYK